MSLIGNIVVMFVCAIGLGCATTAPDGATGVPAHSRGLDEAVESPDEVHPLVAAAADRVQVMTMPAVESPGCFPQALVAVRRIDGVIETGDVRLYENRRLDKAYHRVVFQDGDRFGYCTPLGEVVIPARFDDAEVFQEGIAVVQLDGGYGYIDQWGEWVVPPTLQFAYGFWHGAGAAKSGGKYGLVDHAGRWVKPPQFVHMAAVGGGITAQAANGEEGFLDATGDFIKTGPLASFYRPPPEGD